MRVARQLAARSAVAALLIASLLPVPAARAEGQLQLILPLVAALATASTVRGAPRDAFGAAGGVSGFFRLLPPQLEIPDGYAEDDLPGPPRFAAPVDKDRIVAFALFDRPKRGWMVTVAYDQENRGRLHGSSDVLRFIAERHF